MFLQANEPLMIHTHNLNDINQELSQSIEKCEWEEALSWQKKQHAELSVLAEAFHNGECNQQLFIDAATKTMLVNQKLAAAVKDNKTEIGRQLTELHLGKTAIEAYHE
ncbi:MAG: hypothetical protein ACWA5R_11735 [bacterium]